MTGAKPAQNWRRTDARHSLEVPSFAPVRQLRQSI